MHTFNPNQQFTNASYLYIGLRGASASLKRNFNTARDAMRAVPEDISQRGSAAGVAQAVARAAPIMLLRPAIGATEAISRTLLGVNNHLDPDNQRKVDDVSFLPFLKSIPTFSICKTLTGVPYAEIQEALSSGT